MTDLKSAPGSGHRTDSDSLVPVERFDGVADLHLQSLSGKSFSVIEQNLRFDCYFRRVPGSSCLFVLLNASIDRKVHQLPYFARRRWSDVLQGHLLCINDPTLYLQPTLGTGWYLGTFNRDPIVGLVQIAKHAADLLGVTHERVIFYGSASGAFAAIMSAVRYPGGRCVAINPYVEVSSGAPAARSMAELFSGEKDLEKAREMAPARWSTLAAVREARQSGVPPRILVVHNPSNAGALATHYSDFCREFRVPLDGGVSADNNIRSRLYSGAPGSTEPKELAREIIADELAFLLGEAQSAPQLSLPFDEPDAG